MDIQIIHRDNTECVARYTKNNYGKTKGPGVVKWLEGNIYTTMFVMWQ